MHEGMIFCVLNVGNIKSNNLYYRVKTTGQNYGAKINVHSHKD